MGSNPSRDARFCEQLAINCSQAFTKDLLDKFLASRATGTSPKTIRVYHLALDNFIDHPITPESINRYLNSLTCGNAKHNYYRCIKTLCRWLYLNDYVKFCPTDKVLPPKRQKRLLPAISKEQLDILVSRTSSERDKVILNLLWYSGMRLSETANVKTKDFDWS